jgi:hypothetical protein
MEVTFRNTNRIHGVNNIRITIEADFAAGQGAVGSVFTPVGGSNTLFIDQLAPQEAITKVLRFFTVPDAEPRSYSLTVNFEYQDPNFDVLRAEERISIPVAQVTRLEQVGLEHIPDLTWAGDTVWFNMQVLNTGRVDLRNVRARMEAPWDVTEATFPHIGNLRQGQTITLNGRFTPWEEGFHDAVMVIYGEDAMGAIEEYRHYFTIEVMGGGGGFADWEDDWRDPWLDEEWEDPFAGMIWCDETFDWIPDPALAGGDGFLAFIRRPVVWGPAAGLVALCVIVGVVLIVRKRNRLEFEGDED